MFLLHVVATGQAIHNGASVSQRTEVLYVLHVVLQRIPRGGVVEAWIMTEAGTTT